MADLFGTNRALWNGPTRRALLFKWALCATLLSGMALCPRLWTSARAFPTVPAFAFVPDLPAWTTVGLTALLILAIVAVAALPHPQPALWAVVLLSAALALFDINRLQPWFCQALLLFFALGSVEAQRWRLCAFVLAATYFWSGLQKAGLPFGEKVLPLFLHPFGLDRLQPLWPVAPILETSIGLLLVFPRTRVWGVAGAVAMHALLLLALGPLGQNVNSVVWPWNLGMPTLVAVTISGTSSRSSL